MQIIKYLINYFRFNWLPILFAIGGILDQTTDLLVELLNELNAPIWTGTLLRIVVISFGSIKLYITKPKNQCK
jgi:hypothetical protein